MYSCPFQVAGVFLSASASFCHFFFSKGEKKKEKNPYKLSRALNVDSASSRRRAAIKISTLEVGRGGNMSCVQLQQCWTLFVHVWMLHALKVQTCQTYIVLRFWEYLIIHLQRVFFHISCQYCFSSLPLHCWYSHSVLHRAEGKKKKKKSYWHGDLILCVVVWCVGVSLCGMKRAEHKRCLLFLQRINIYFFFCPLCFFFSFFISSSSSRWPVRGVGSCSCRRRSRRSRSLHYSASFSVLHLSIYLFLTWGWFCLSWFSSRPQVQLFLTALLFIIDQCRSFYYCYTQTFPSSYRTQRPLLHCCADTSSGIDPFGRRPIRMSCVCSSRQGADLLRCGGINASRCQLHCRSSLQWLSARCCFQRLIGELSCMCTVPRFPPSTIVLSECWPSTSTLLVSVFKLYFHYYLIK